nr:reverse transcriptase domain-containing protein [Tanacetum cinerariifolium]
IFRDLHFKLSFTDALVHMPKFAPMFKKLLNNKDKLIELTKTPLNENCSAVVLKKIPEKLGGIDFESEEIEDFLDDDSIPFGVKDSPFNMDEDILFLEKSSTKNLIPIPNECIVVLGNGSQSTEHVNDNSSIFTTISNPLSDVESNSDESTSNHDTEKSDYLDEFYGPFIPIYILKEERTRREDADYINQMEMLFMINPRPHKLRMITRMSNLFPHFQFQIRKVNLHENSESEDFDFDNPLLPLPPPEPPNKKFVFEIDFQKEISVVRNVIVKFECIDARVKFDVFNDENNVLSYCMFVIFAKEFSLLSVESDDAICDPGISE